MAAAESIRRQHLAELVQEWRVLLAAVTGVALGVNSLPFYTSGLFINALHLDQGWSLASLSLGPTLLVLSMALTAPILGSAFDRYGERCFIFPGLLVQVTALLFLSRIESLTSYYALLAGMALLGSGCAAPAYIRIVNRTFDKAKGTALAITITGAAALSAVVPPLLQQLITTHGWRSAYVALAIVVAVGVPVMVFLLRGTDRVRIEVRPDRARPLSRSVSCPDSGYCGLLYDRTFLLLAAAIAMISIACPGLLIHFMPMLTAGGIDATTAAWIISLIGVTQILSRLFTGVLVDRFFAPIVAACIMGLSAMGFALMCWGGTGWAIAGAVAVGLAYGAEADLIGYLTGRYYEPARFGRVFGIFYAVFLTGTAVSPSLYGVIVDTQGSYQPSLAIATVFLLMASIVFLRLPRFPGDSRVESGANASLVAEVSGQAH
jgi:MFS family permease